MSWVDSVPAPCTHAFGRLYLEGCAGGPLGPLSRPARSRCVFPEAIGDGFSSESLACLSCGAWRPAANGTPDQGVSGQETPSSPLGQGAMEQDGPGRCALFLA